jgi:PAS domain S-box-containing protein
MAPAPIDYAQLYRVLAETAPDAIIAIDEASVVLSLNPAGERLLGRPAAEVVGRSLTLFMPERLRAGHAAGMGRYLRSGERRIPWHALRLPILASDGREVPTEVSFGELHADGRRIFSGIIRDVTERVAAEHALAEQAALLQEQATELEQQVEEAQALSEELQETNEQLFGANHELEEAKAAADANAHQVQSILDTLDDAVSVFDGEWRWTYVNPAAAEVLRALGRDPGAVIGRVLWDELPELLGTRFETETRRAAETGAIVVYEEYLPSLERWFETRLVPSDGALTSFTRDVTERRRAHEVLRHQEEEFRALANSIPALAWIARPDGWIYWYNERWYDYTGTQPSDMTGWGWQQVHDPAVLPSVLEQWTHSIGTGEPFEMVFPLRSAAGPFRRFLTRVAPVRDQAGAIVRWFGVNTDVEAQYASREALSSVVEAVTDGFVAFDPELRYTYVNQRAAEMWGMPAPAFLGRTPAEMWPELDLDQAPLFVLFRRVLATRRMEVLEAYGPTLHSWVETRAYPAAGGGIVVFFQDVSERRRAQEAASVLAEASELLASSTDYNQTLANVARAMVPRLGDWSAVDLVEDPASAAWPPVVHRVAIVHDDPRKLALAAEIRSRYPQRWDGASGMARVIRDGTSLFIPAVTDDMLATLAQDDEHLRLLRTIELRSIIIVPITARGRVLGALSLAMTGSERRHTDADLALAEDLGRRAGVALDTVRLLRDTQDARSAAEAAAERTARLQHVAGSLAGALTEREVADTVIAEGIPAFGATDGVIYRLSQDGLQLEYVASAGLPEAAIAAFQSFPVTASLPVSDAVRMGESVVVETREDIVTRYPAVSDANSHTRTISWIAVPVRAGGSVLGGMALGFAVERRFTTEDRTFAETLAGLCGQALLRARLYDEAERARAAAEEANKAKLTFLATMSHELRTPLNAIAGHVQLMDMGLRGAVTEEQRDALERINRAQAHLLGLINDILTYAKVESGRLEYDLKPVDAAALLRETCGLVEPQFTVKGLRLGCDPALHRLPPGDGSVRVMADRDKLSQIVLNLLSNALKFTPAPGSVTVTLAPLTAGSRFLTVVVSDTGPGIPGDKLESVFEPFVQLGRGLTTAHEGTGLGLAISRDLARGMGGDLTVASTAGEGASFILTLCRAG